MSIIWIALCKIVRAYSDGNKRPPNALYYVVSAQDMTGKFQGGLSIFYHGCVYIKERNTRGF